MRATIWSSDFQRIQQAFRDRGVTNAFQESQEICALCSVRYHAVHGLTLMIFDVDPSAGESHIERNRHRVLSALAKDGLLDTNKTRSLGVAPLRIGLITAAGSAAYADFAHTLSSPFGFQIVFAPASMQGAGTAGAVVQALRQLATRNLDLICVIRGGGSCQE